MNQYAEMRQPIWTSGSPCLFEVVGRRSQLEIRMDILRAIIEGALRPAQIMQRTDLSWVPLLDNLNSLTEEGLVSKDTTSNQWSYSVTKKGIEMVRTQLNQTHEIAC